MAGHYDDECATLAAITHARASVVVVIDGAKGHGFSITMLDPDAALCTILATVLRDVAEKMDDTARTLRLARDN